MKAYGIEQSLVGRIIHEQCIKFIIFSIQQFIIPTIVQIFKNQGLFASFGSVGICYGTFLSTLQNKPYSYEIHQLQE